MKTNTALKISAGMLALFIALSPLATFAKEKEGKENKGKGNAKAELTVAAKAQKHDDDDQGENEGNKGKNSCVKAFGHLIAPGWIKKNGTSTISDDCWLPFGIAKKFRGGTNTGTSTPTTTPDTSAPVITSINASPKQVVANITWITNEKSDSTVFYATSSNDLDVNATATPRVSKSGMVKDHNVQISGLATSTTYYFKVASKDASGNTAYSDIKSFTTKSPVVNATYPVISQIVTLNGTSTVNIAWKTNESATSKVYYSTTTPDTNSSSTPFVLDSTLVTNHSVLVSGLSTSTGYTFVVESKNAQGNATLSNSFSITTNN